AAVGVDPFGWTPEYLENSNPREELSRLKRENRMLRQEREILNKAAASFASETDRSVDGVRVHPATNGPP
ncbi:MAG: hypothetical protein QF368_11145, partial [SAR202 cluster bacterium]|nr:hypothetical protein [SAR202 cluster bacterium]